MLTAPGLQIADIDKSLIATLTAGADMDSFNALVADSGKATRGKCESFVGKHFRLNCA